MGKTIITYLIDGTSHGARSVVIGNKSCKMFVIPRTSLKTVQNRMELKQPALYILLGENEDESPKAYIGETETFLERINNHDNEDKKNFWETALVFIADGNKISKADVQYLEHLALALEKESKHNYSTENVQVPKAPTLPEYQIDTIKEFFEDVKMLTAFVNCSIFEIEKKNKDFFYIKEANCNATGFFNESGFTVLKDSVLAGNTTPSFKGGEKRKRFIQENANSKGNNYILKSDYTFSSPSTAASFCTGGSRNGWIVWKNDKHQTLDDFYRL